MGGFTSTAPVLAGRFRGIATFIHESNAVPGKANRWTARAVNAVMLGFKECAPFFPKTRTEITGTPVRTELIPLDRAESRRKLGLREDLPTLLYHIKPVFQAEVEQECAKLKRVNLAVMGLDEEFVL